MFSTSTCSVFVNYPPSYVELDVSREKITRFKEIGNTGLTFVSPAFRASIESTVAKQAIDSLDKCGRELFLIDSVQVLRFLSTVGMSTVSSYASKCRSLNVAYSQETNSVVFVFCPWLGPRKPF